MRFRFWIIVALALFGVGIGLGIAPPASFTDFISEDISAIQQLSRFLAGFPPALIALLIFVKNASALLFGFVFGPLLCLVPIITLLTNGLLLSAVSIMVGQEKSFVFVVGGILPHGIFELPAFIIGEAAALSFSVMVMVALVKREMGKRFWPGLKQNARYLVIALALLVPAAVIETYITPLVLAWLMPR